MVKDKVLLQKFKDKMIANEKLSFKNAMSLFSWLWEEGIKLKVLPSKEPINDISHIIKLAKIINMCSKNY